jgi:hypothetical protein
MHIKRRKTEQEGRPCQHLKADLVPAGNGGTERQHRNSRNHCDGTTGKAL